MKKNFDGNNDEQEDIKAFVKWYEEYIA